MNSLLYLLYIITFIVSMLLVISGLVMVFKKFFHPGFYMVDGTVVDDSCRIGDNTVSPSGCNCGLGDKTPKVFKAFNCVKVSFTPKDQSSGTKTVENIIVSNKYQDGSKIQLLINSSADSSSITAKDIEIYNPDTFINGLIMTGVGLLFLWFAWSGLRKKKKQSSYNTVLYLR